MLKCNKEKFKENHDKIVSMCKAEMDEYDAARKKGCNIIAEYEYAIYKRLWEYFDHGVLEDVYAVVISNLPEDRLPGLIRSCRAAIASICSLYHHPNPVLIAPFYEYYNNLNEDLEI